MKLVILCALLPLAICLQPFSLGDLVNDDKIKSDFVFLMHIFANSDLTRKACEFECRKLDKNEKDLNLGCPLACAGLQEGLKKLLNQSPSKRAFILGTLNSTGLFDIETLKADLQIMVDVIGSDPAEVTCENECHNLLAEGHVLHFACDLVCHLFQKLVHLFEIKPDTTPTVLGRF